MPLTQQQKRDLNIIYLEAYTMVSKEAINAKFEALEARIKDKIRMLFNKLRLGRPLSPKKSYQGESFAQSHQARRDEFEWRGGSMTDPNYPHMRLDFPRWEEGDPIGWISHAERYFRYHKIADASMVKIAAIHLEGDAIQWFH